MTRDLTPRQREILAYLREFTYLYGYAPTVREICQRFDVQSTNSMAGVLRCLEKKGAIRRDPLKSRAIVVLDALPHCAGCERLAEENRRLRGELAKQESG